MSQPWSVDFGPQNGQFPYFGHNKHYEIINIHNIHKSPLPKWRCCHVVQFQKKSPNNIFWEKLKNVDFDPKMPHLPHFEHK